MRPTAARQPSQDGPTPACEEAPDLPSLVTAAIRGDEAAWETIVRVYGRRIYAMAKSRLRDADAAEEITQSVFATLAAKLREGSGLRYQEEGKFEPWLFRVTMNRVRDEGRRRQRRSTTVFRLHEADQPTQSTPDGADERDELEAMRDAIRSLDDRDREIIELRHHGALSFAQIADTLGEPMGTVLARHHRALKKLRSRIESATGEPTDHNEGHDAPRPQRRAAGGTDHA